MVRFLFSGGVLLCSNPYKRGALQLRCGSCMPCRISLQRLWSTRIELEAACHAYTTFATLTYAPEHLPPDGSLSNHHWRLLTHKIGFRYFGVGEYGDLSFRPHYHLMCFGVECSEAFRLWLESRWRKGHVDVLPYHARLGRYIAGYVLKKMTKQNDPRLKPGMLPEFSRMSRRPALGAGIVAHLAKATLRDRLKCQSELDVVKTVRIDGKEVPVGRTLVNKTRKAVQMPDYTDARMRRMAEFESKLAYEFPELSDNREVKRVTQQERAEGLARLSRRSKI